MPAEGWTLRCPASPETPSHGTRLPRAHALPFSPRASVPAGAEAAQAGGCSLSAASAGAAVSQAHACLVPAPLPAYARRKGTASVTANFQICDVSKTFCCGKPPSFPSVLKQGGGKSNRFESSSCEGCFLTHTRRTMVF